MSPLIKSARRLPGAIGALACLDVGLSWLGWLAFISGPSIDEPIADTGWKPPALTLPASAGVKLLSAGSEDPILTRPMFFSSRRPFEPPPPPRDQSPQLVAPPPPVEPTFVVDGILLSAKLREAKIRQPKEAEGRWHAVGSSIDGWAIVAIDAAGIVVEQGGRRVPVQLYPLDPRAFRIEPLARTARLR